MNIIYSEIEKEYYTYLLHNYNSNKGSDFIGGGDVVKLFLKANVDKNILKTIWDISSFRKARDLNKEEFFYACRNIVLAQERKNLNKQNIIELNNKNILPKFEGINFQNKNINNNNFNMKNNNNFMMNNFNVNNNTNIMNMMYNSNVNNIKNMNNLMMNNNIFFNNNNNNNDNIMKSNTYNY